MSIRIKPGKVLLADPFMLDPHFKRSVIALCDHSNGEGTIGFILNKPISSKLSELVEDFPAFNAPLFYGGPVATDTVHYIHNVGELLEESEMVMPGLYWGGNFEKLKFLIQSELITEKNIRFFIGYSGWSAGQLRSELKGGSWVVAEMHPNYAFKSKPWTLWKQVMKNKGQIFTVISQIPDSYNLN